jgi:hypothetical protein
VNLHCRLNRVSPKKRWWWNQTKAQKNPVFKDPTPFKDHIQESLAEMIGSCRFNDFKQKTKMLCCFVLFCALRTWQGWQDCSSLRSFGLHSLHKTMFPIVETVLQYVYLLHVMLCYICLCLYVSCSQDSWVQASGFARKVKRGKFHRFRVWFFRIKKIIVT